MSLPVRMIVGSLVAVCTAQMYKFVKFSLAIEYVKVCKPQYLYSGASANADDDAGCLFAVQVRLYLLQDFNTCSRSSSACVFCVLCYSLKWNMSLKTLLLICIFFFV